MIVLLAFQYAISDTVASTYTIEAYDYEKIVFLTGDQTFNVKILLFLLFSGLMIQNKDILFEQMNIIYK
jgi:hypothetical protein